VKSLESAAQPNASDKLFSIVLRVRRNEVFKVLGLDLSLVGFREILLMSLKWCLMRRSTGLTNPGSPLGSGCPASQRVPPRCRTQYSYAPTFCDSICAPFLCNGCALQAVCRNPQQVHRAQTKAYRALTVGIFHSRVAR
jgi:hypothetical protein